MIFSYSNVIAVTPIIPLINAIPLPIGSPAITKRCQKSIFPTIIQSINESSPATSYPNTFNTNGQTTIYQNQQDNSLIDRVNQIIGFQNIPATAKNCNLNVLFPASYPISAINGKSPPLDIYSLGANGQLSQSLSQQTQQTPMTDNNFPFTWNTPSSFNNPAPQLLGTTTLNPGQQSIVNQTPLDCASGLGSDQSQAQQGVQSRGYEERKRQLTGIGGLSNSTDGGSNPVAVGNGKGGGGGGTMMAFLIQVAKAVQQEAGVNYNWQALENGASGISQNSNGGASQNGNVNSQAPGILNNGGNGNGGVPSNNQQNQQSPTSNDQSGLDPEGSASPLIAAMTASQHGGSTGSVNTAQKRQIPNLPSGFSLPAGVSIPGGGTSGAGQLGAGAGQFGGITGSGASGLSGTGGQAGGATLPGASQFGGGGNIDYGALLQRLNATGIPADSNGHGGFAAGSLPANLAQMLQGGGFSGGNIGGNAASSGTGFPGAFGGGQGATPTAGTGIASGAAAGEGTGGNIPGVGGAGVGGASGSVPSTVGTSRRKRQDGATPNTLTSQAGAPLLPGDVSPAPTNVVSSGGGGGTNAGSGSGGGDYGNGIGSGILPGFFMTYDC